MSNIFSFLLEAPPQVMMWKESFNTQNRYKWIVSICLPNFIAWSRQFSNHQEVNLYPSSKYKVIDIQINSSIPLFKHTLTWFAHPQNNKKAKYRKSETTRTGSKRKILKAEKTVDLTISMILSDDNTITKQLMHKIRRKHFPSVMDSQCRVSVL